MARARDVIARLELVAPGWSSSRPAGARRARLGLVSVDEALLDAAALLGDPVLRTLDAIHLAAARAFGEELEQIVTYDLRLAGAAGGLGLPIIAPW